MRSKDCVARRAAPVVLMLTLVGGLAGCESLVVTAVGAGASSGVSHSLNSVAYRTFTAPSAKVKGATLNALNRMAIKVESAKLVGSDDQILASAANRKIEVEIESLTPNTTRMRAVARQGLVYDGATATEIIVQTEKSLGNA